MDHDDEKKYIHIRMSIAVFKFQLAYQMGNDFNGRLTLLQMAVWQRNDENILGLIEWISKQIWIISLEYLNVAIIKTLTTAIDFMIWWEYRFGMGMEKHLTKNLTMIIVYGVQQLAAAELFYHKIEQLT